MARILDRAQRQAENADGELMSQPDRIQTIWGINRDDRILFITMTVVSGTALASAFAALTIMQRPPEQTEADLLFRLIVGIPASFTATGIVSWAILNAREVIVFIGNSLRERTAKRRKALRDEGREEGRQEGREEGRREARQEGREEARQAMQEILAALESGQSQESVAQLIRDNLEGKGKGG